MYRLGCVTVSREYRRAEACSAEEPQGLHVGNGGFVDCMCTVSMLQEKGNQKVNIDDVRKQVKTTLAAYKDAGIKWIVSGWYKSALRTGVEVARGTRFHISSIRPERVLDVPVLTPPQRARLVPVVHGVIRDQAPPQEERPAAPEPDAAGEEHGRGAAPPAEAAPEAEGRGDAPPAEAVGDERGPQAAPVDGRTGRPQAGATATQVVPLSEAPFVADSREGVQYFDRDEHK